MVDWVGWIFLGAMLFVCVGGPIAILLANDADEQAAEKARLEANAAAVKKQYESEAQRRVEAEVKQGRYESRNSSTRPFNRKGAVIERLEEEDE